MSQPGLAVGGRLRHFSAAWRLLGDAEVSRIIEDGLRLELLSLPEQDHIPHRELSLEQEELFAEELDALLRKEAVKALDFVQDSPAMRTHVAAGFCVPKATGGARPVIDWRDLNLHTLKRHFKMESLKTVQEQLEVGDFMAKIDIKDAYLHIPIAEEHQPFLRFNFRGRTYQCLAMLFGLTAAPRVFTRVLQPLVKVLRSEGIRIVVYLDDFLVLGRSLAETRKNVARTLQLLTELGWLVNVEKSVLVPSQQLVYLGIAIDSVRMTFSLPEEKLRKLRESVVALLNDNRENRLSLRTAAKVLGMMTAAAQGIELARLHERPLLQEVQQRLSSGATWEETILLSAATTEACGWWLGEFREWNGISVIPPGQATAWLTTDASELGFGVTVKSSSLDIHTQWKLPPNQAHRSSNWRELSAIAFALERLGESLQGQVLQIASDSMTSLSCIRHQGSRYPELTAVAARVLLLAAQWGIRLATVFVPGKENVVADHLSRWFVADPAGYQLSAVVLQRLQETWGPLSMDLFASNENRLLARFFSWNYCPQAAGTDAFRQAWPEWALAHPPMGIIGRVLEKVQRERVRNLVLIAPHWPSQPWWPRLQRLCQAPPLLLERITPQYLQGCGLNQPPPHYQRWKFSAWLLSASD